MKRTVIDPIIQAVGDTYCLFGLLGVNSDVEGGRPGPMLKKVRWKRVFVASYFLGYSLYVTAAAVLSFPLVGSIKTWLYYLGFQVLYGLAWPIIVVLDMAGYRW